MTKKLALLCVVLMLFSLAACTKDETPETETFTAPTVENSALIFRTLPSAYITDDPYFFDPSGYAEEQGYKSVVYNAESDTFTLEMDGERYNKLVSDLFTDITTGVKELAQSDLYPYIKDIQFNEDLSEFTLYVDRATYFAIEDYTPEYIASFASMYLEILGLEPKVSFTIVDAADGTSLGFMILPDEE